MGPRYRHLVTPALLAALALGGCGGGGSTSSSAANTSSSAASTSSPAASTPAASAPAEPTSGPEKVAIKDFEYDPKTLDVQAGAKVSWTNEDVANHTVTFDDGSENLGSQSKDKTVSFTFKKPGTYAYHCDFHPNMHGTVVVK